MKFQTLGLLAFCFPALVLLPQNTFASSAPRCSYLFDISPNGARLTQYDNLLHYDILVSPDQARYDQAPIMPVVRDENPIWRQLAAEGSHAPSDNFYGIFRYPFADQNMKPGLVKSLATEQKNQFLTDIQVGFKNGNYRSTQLLALASRYYQLYTNNLFDKGGYQPGYFTLSRYGMNYFYDLGVDIAATTLKSLSSIKVSAYDFRTFQNEALQILKRYVGDALEKQEPAPGWKKADKVQDYVKAIGFTYLEISIQRLTEQLQNNQLSPEEIKVILSYAKSRRAAEMSFVDAEIKSQLKSYFDEVIQLVSQPAH